MKIFDFIQADQPKEIFGESYLYRILPKNSVVLQNVLKHGNINLKPQELTQGLKTISVDAEYVFVDDSSDTVAFSDLEILFALELIKQQFGNCKPVFLSGKCSHYYSAHKNIIWYPKFLLWDYPTQHRPRQKRIGCLNRRNAPHRVWLMYNLLEEGIIDHDRDIFSISFVDFLDKNHTADIDGWIKKPGTNYNSMIKQYPDTIATMPDHFSSSVGIDMTTEHPAWHTAITVVTETECGDLAMISEKIMKAIAAECCWIAYTGVDSIRVLNDLQFDTKLFEHHASGTDIECIRQVCKMIDTQDLAMDYRHSRRHQIQHNKQHLVSEEWLKHYVPKLESVLNSL